MLGPISLPEWDPRLPMIIGGLLLVAGIAWFALRGLRTTMGPGVTGPPAEERAGGTPPQRMRADAVHMARSGDYRAAVRTLYAALLLHWDEIGKLRFDRALTNREVLAQARQGDGGAARAAMLEPLVDRFDRYWYGAARCGADDYAVFAALVDAAWNEP